LGPDVDYVVARTSAFGVDDELLVVAEARREAVLGDGGEVVARVTAAELAGSHYRPPFAFVTPPAGADLHYVVTGDFVTTGDGSGIVHLAPAFGADDMAVGRREGLPVLNPVDADGRFT